MDQPTATDGRAQSEDGVHHEMRPEVVLYPLVVVQLDSDDCVAYHQIRRMDLSERALHRTTAP
jgi:hypothetical protein